MTGLEKGHREDCPDGCADCIDYRAWDTCAACGAEVEAEDDGLTPCCAAPIAGPDPFGEDWVMEGRLYR